jgi:hypothetical protein
MFQHVDRGTGIPFNVIFVDVHDAFEFLPRFVPRESTGAGIIRKEPLRLHGIKLWID